MLWIFRRSGAANFFNSINNNYSSKSGANNNNHSDKNVTRPHRKEYGRLSLDEDSAASSTSNDGSNNGTSCCAGFDETRLKCSGSGGNGLGADAAASGPSAFVCDGYNNHHQHDHNTHSSYCETTPTSHGAPTAHGLSASTSMMSTTTTATENSQHGSSMDGCSSSSTNGGAGGGSVGISCCIGCNCGEHVATDGLHGADNNANGCMSAAVHGDPRLQAMATSDDDEFDESLTCNVCDRAFNSHRQLASHQQKKRHFGCGGCDSLFPSLMLLEHHKEEFEHWSDMDDDDAGQPSCCRRGRGRDDYLTDSDSITSDAESEDLERLL